MLTDEEIAAAAPREKAFKLFDGGGLFVLVSPKGAKSFRLKYRLRNREKQATFGLFPEVKIAQARQMRDEAKRLLRDKVDPSRGRALPNISALSQLRSLPLQPEEPNQIYFIQSSGAGGAIKIGVTRDVDARLQSLQQATPEQLVVLGTLRGGYAAEMAILRHFSSDVIRGEWFSPSPSLLGFIREHAQCR